MFNNPLSPHSRPHRTAPIPPAHSTAYTEAMERRRELRRDRGRKTGLI